VTQKQHGNEEDGKKGNVIMNREKVRVHDHNQHSSSKKREEHSGYTKLKKKDFQRKVDN